MDRLGLEELMDSTLRLGGRVCGARPGRKVGTLVGAMLAGATHIDHADRLLDHVDRLRSGSTGRVLGPNGSYHPLPTPTETVAHGAGAGASKPRPAEPSSRAGSSRGRRTRNGIGIRCRNEIGRVAV